MTIRRIIRIQTPAKMKNKSFLRLIISKLKTVCNAIDMSIPVNKKNILVFGFIIRKSIITPIAVEEAGW